MFEHHCSDNSSSSTVQAYAVAGISLLLALVTIPGNLLVCLAVLKASNNNIRNPFNYFVLSLAIADLVVGCVMEPMSVYVHLKEAISGRPVDIVELKFLHLSYFISCTTSVLSICLLGIERYLAILSPMKFRLLFSIQRFLTLATIVWLISISLSSIYLFTTYSIYAIVFITNAVGWTLAVSVFTYVKILRKFKERMADTSLSAGRVVPKNASPPNPWNVQLTKTYMVIISIFLACYIPAGVVIYTMNWCKTCSCITLIYLQDLQFIIVAFNSAFNPFVYAFRFQRFRRAVVQMLRCGMSRPKSIGFVSTTTLSRSTKSLQNSREFVHI